MKQYVKPDLYYENFELSQHIATCGIDVCNASDKFSCAYLDESFWDYSDRVFEANYNCVVDRANVEGYCETVGTNEAGRLFNS